jgi:hypothetical protein
MRAELLLNGLEGDEPDPPRRVIIRRAWWCASRAERPATLKKMTASPIRAATSSASR